MSSPNHVPHPVDRDPDALVENMYPMQGTLTTPDLESQDTMSEYLMDRFARDPGPRTRLILTETGKTLPRIERQIVGTKETSYYERDGWIITPKVAAGVFAASLIVANAAPAALDIADEAKQLGHDIYRIFKPVESHIEITQKKTPVTGPLRHIQVNADAENLSGSVDVDRAAVQRFEGQVAKVVRKGGKVVSVKIVGRSSDDYGSNESIGKPEPAYQDFADDRAKTYADTLREMPIFANAPIITEVDQSVLTPVQKTKMEQAAEAAGFTGPNNIIDAINSVVANEQQGTKLSRLVNRLFTAKRGVTLDAGVTMPGEKSVLITDVETEIPGVDKRPENPDRDYHPWFIPPIPIPRFRRIIDGIKPIKRFRMLPGRQLFTPSILKEEEDQAWLRIRPEAVKEDGTLVENSWAFTRKYEHLLRDGRIADVLRADYTDSEGKEKALRILFIDKSPAQETLDAFADLLTKFSAMQDGKLGDRVSGIFVYPSENTGTNHRDPKRIAMGIDKQSSGNILGTYTYILDLVELHMPSTWDAEELEAMFHEFHGPRWTLAHEVGGHGTDDNDAPLSLRRVHARGIPNAHILRGDARARRMDPLHNLLRRLPRTAHEKEALSQFKISYPVVDNNGNIVTMEPVVTERDARLAHVSHASIVGQQPTQYSDESVTEHYAETAAAVITGDTIPFDEAHVQVQGQQLTADNGTPASFATGYRPDVRAQALFTESVGATPGSYPVSFAKTQPVRISHVAPANDPLIRQELMRTRRLRSLKPHEMVAILARVSQRNRSGERS